MEYDSLEESDHEKKAVENYLRQIDQHIITSSTDLQGRIIKVSEAFSKISGYTKSELIGKMHNIVRHEDMNHDIYENMWKDLQSDKVWSGEIKNKAKDGTYYWVKATISPDYDKNDNKSGYTAIRQLITDKKDLELSRIELENSFTKLQASQDIINSQTRMSAMGETISVLAHQWRQPLTIISTGIIDLEISIQMGKSNEKQLEKIKKISTTLQKLSSTISEFSNYIHENKLNQFSPLNEIINQSTSLEGQDLSANGININISIEKSLEFLSVSQQLIQVLVNVITNAIESLQKSEDDDKSINIDVSKVTNNCHILIEDTGVGVQKIENAFEPYATTKQELNGKGLSLYLSRIIIEKTFKGKMRLYNNQTKGATLEIVFPLDAFSN
ncbi:MAG: PAS domain-containing sensor histidine kinase [Thiovulaceae bacterium]|nr:PAS domain-containing sensor histidine kinase [Sulfurimonadaceae bacterium]